MFVIVRHKRRQNTNRNNLKPAADNVLAINLNNFHGTSNGKVSNGNVYNGVATEEEHVKEMNGKWCIFPLPVCLDKTRDEEFLVTFVKINAMVQHRNCRAQTAIHIHVYVLSQHRINAVIFKKNFICSP